MENIIIDLQSSDPQTRINALIFLHEQATDISEHALLILLAEQLQSPHPDIRYFAALVFAETAEPVCCIALLPQLAQSLDVGDPAVTRHILRFFERCSPSEQVRSLVKPLVSNSDPVIRIYAVSVLLLHGENLQYVLTHIAESLQDNDIDCLCLCCQLLGNIGEQGAAFQSKLLGLVRHTDADVRSNALSALCGIANDDTLLREVATSLLNDSDPKVQYGATKVIQGWRPRKPSL